MRFSTSRTVHVFAILNYLFGFFGLVFLLRSLSDHTPGPAEPRQLAEVYLFRVVFNVLCLLLLLIAGVFLWRLERRGLILANCVFALELLYFVGGSVLTIFLVMAANDTLVDLGKALGQTAGSGDIGLAPQLLTLYPVIALVVLNMAYRRLPSGQRQKL